MNFEQWIEAMGLVLADLRDDQKAKLQAKYNAEIKAAADKSGKPIEAAAKTIEAPRFDLSGLVLAHEKHVTTIQATAAKYTGKVEAGKLAELTAKATTAAVEAKASALKDEWATPRLEAEHIKAAATFEADLMVAERPTGPAIHASSKDLTAPVIEASICVAAGLREVEKAYKPEVLEAASKLRVGGLQDVLVIQARANGYSGPSVRIRRDNLRDVLRAAFAPIQAGFSTVSLPGIFSNVANKFLLEGFMDVEQVWREFSTVRSVSDFKTVTSYRMTDDMAFEEVGPTGEVEHGEVGEESYTNRAKTYAKMFALTREQIINDDLGAFDTIRARLGRGGGIKLNRVFWATFLDDATFFSAGHSNLIANVLGEAGIAAAVLALNSQTDGNDNPIDIGGQHVLLTGPTLNPTAKKWYVSQEMRDTTASTKAPTTNIYQNQYRPVMTRYITSATAWYLVPVSAGDMAPMEVAFLDGNQTPIIESAEADFGTLGVEFRGYWDFGPAKKEWRASVKSTGGG